MFLKSIELFGFKSFADRSKLEFSSGITALLGPNGCGKSNIVDSIKWVLGEQSIKTLRAGKMEDVIFNGTENRKKLNVAEVVLVISNEEGYLPLDVSEISIKRRIYRSGESEYFINNTPAKLKDVKELFYDTGIGKSAYSILEQGKIDQILSQKPEDRRYIFEEAAGITRYKQKSIEAERKLEKTEDNIRQVQSILKEVKHTYDTRKVQAEKAERYRVLERQIFDIEVDLQLSRVQELRQRRQQKQDALLCAEEEYVEIKEYITASNEELEEDMDAVNRLSNERIDIQNRLHRIDESKNSKKNQIDILYDRIMDFERLVLDINNRVEQLVNRMKRDAAEIEEKEERKQQIAAELEKIQTDVKSFQETISTAEERILLNTKEIDTTEKLITRLEKQQLVLRKELQEITENIVKELDAKLKESNYSLHRRKELEDDIATLIDNLRIVVQGRLNIINDAEKLAESDGLNDERIINAVARDLTRVYDMLETVKTKFFCYTDEIPAFIDDFLSPAGIITKKRAIDSAIETSYTTIESSRQKIQRLHAENAAYTEKLNTYRKTLESLKLTEVELRGKHDNLNSMVKTLHRSIDEQEIAIEDAKKDLEIAKQRLQETRERIESLQRDSLEITQEERELSKALALLLQEIEKRQSDVVKRKEVLGSKQENVALVSQRIERNRAEIESIESEISYVYLTFEENYSKGLTEFEGRLGVESGEKSALRSRLKMLKQKVAELGYINHMAAEEFSEVKERYDFLKRQLTDLERAKNDLQAITKEITARSEVLFEECYIKIKKNFHAMFRRLFGGGRAELRLVDPNDVLHSGIDIFAQPPGKKLEKISLLSGGERSLTAVAMLFATYLVKPSPFCILDEIDAALDDANIGYFLDVLRDFSENSQFIIITHNKKTVLGSATLLGVTMQEPGVSKVITYRISEDPQEKTE